MSAPAAVVLRGLQPLTLSAAAWRRVAGGDSVLLQNVAFQWSTSDKTAATVDPSGGTPGQAEVTGIKRGQGQVAAVGGEFEKRLLGGVDLRGAGPPAGRHIFPHSSPMGPESARVC